ncbi:hypothetical protein IT570_08525 [Candidatus Sumerlaeota bacterium]|nr:hypothetical protein [Candidatus Sumerlaeota bacterium]
MDLLLQQMLLEASRKAGLFISSVLLLATMIRWICGYHPTIFRGVRWRARDHECAATIKE